MEDAALYQATVEWFDHPANMIPVESTFSGPSPSPCTTHVKPCHCQSALTQPMLSPTSVGVPSPSPCRAPLVLKCPQPAHAEPR